MEPNPWAAYAPLVAAISSICSALTAVMMWRIHRDNRLESLRPEIIVSGWTQIKGSSTITFDLIENIGKGVAFNIEIVGRLFRAPNSYLADLVIPAIGAGKSLTVSGEILTKHHSENGFEIRCVDGIGRMHVTNYVIIYDSVYERYIPYRDSALFRNERAYWSHGKSWLNKSIRQVNLAFKDQFP